MDFLDRTYERASCEIEDILQHQKFDKQDVELLGDFVDIIKDIEMTYSYQNGMDGSSQMNGSTYGGYMRERSGRMMPMYRGRSMNNGYSRNESKEMMLGHLQNVMDMAVDDKDRKAISRLMEQMRDN